MIPLTIPETLPPHARDYLRQLDEAITKTVADATVTSISYRDAAEVYRRWGDAWEATGADDTADRIDLDPRLHVASCMHNGTPDGRAKMMLHQYMGLLEEQALARRAQRAA